MKHPHRILFALALAACTPTSTGNNPDAAVAALTTRFELRDTMRKLWIDHVTWTRGYLISAIAGLPDADAAAARLLQNQVNIGNAIKPFYGTAAGEALTALLHDHITIAGEVVVAAKANDTVKLGDAKARWYANSDQVAAFLAAANPAWSANGLKAMMKMHLDQTLDEATARLTADWPADVRAYDVIVTHITEMADTLADGIAQQFPDKVSTTTPFSAKGEELHRAMRSLWADHVTWTRVYLISAIAGLPDADVAAGRLLRNQADIGNAIKPFYGAAAGDALAALLHDHITIAAEIVVAAKEGNQDKLGQAVMRWNSNSDDIATFLASANPSWLVDHLKHMMRMHLDMTLAEATARLTGDWSNDIKQYDLIVNEILSMADELSAGIVKQFPEKVL
jgi:hypothetical protein